MAELNRIFSIFLEKKVLGGLILAYARKNAFFGGGQRSVFGAYTAYTRKNSCFRGKPPKNPFWGLIPPFTRKNSFFSEISENGVGLYSLILDQRFFFSGKKFFLARELNSAM